MISLTGSLSRGQLDLAPHRLGMARSMALDNAFLAKLNPAVIVFCFDLFGWIKKLIDELFDDEGLDVKVGLADTPEGAPTHVGVGVQVNIETEDKPAPKPPPRPSYPVPFEKPPEQPRIQIDLTLLYPLGRLTDQIQLPREFSRESLGSFTFPKVEPGESGVGLGIRINF
jgi:hypothetical protein